MSTGSAIALSFMPLARARGIECHFIESAARGDGPSMTGRIASRIPGMRLYTQYPSWADEQLALRGLGARRLPAGSGAGPHRRSPGGGAARHHGARLPPPRWSGSSRILPPDAEVLWQTGSTDLTGLPVDGPPLRALRRGRAGDPATSDACRRPIRAWAPPSAPSSWGARRCSRRAAGTCAEHVDDHQTHIAAELERRGLAVTRDADELELADLERAAGLRAEELSDVPEFRALLEPLRRAYGPSTSRLQLRAGAGSRQRSSCSSRALVAACSSSAWRPTAVAQAGGDARRA